MSRGGLSLLLDPREKRSQNIKIIRTFLHIPPAVIYALSVMRLTHLKVENPYNPCQDVHGSWVWMSRPDYQMYANSTIVHAALDPSQTQHTLIQMVRGAG